MSSFPLFGISLKSIAVISLREALTTGRYISKDWNIGVWMLLSWILMVLLSTVFRVLLNLVKVLRNIEYGIEESLGFNTRNCIKKYWPE